MQIYTRVMVRYAPANNTGTKIVGNGTIQHLPHCCPKRFHRHKRAAGTMWGTSTTVLPTLLLGTRELTGSVGTSALSPVRCCIVDGCVASICRLALAGKKPARKCAALMAVESAADAAALGCGKTHTHTHKQHCHHQSLHVQTTRMLFSETSSGCSL